MGKKTGGGYSKKDKPPPRAEHLQAAANKEQQQPAGTSASSQEAAVLMPPPATPLLPVVPVGEDFLRPISNLAAVRDCYERFGVVGVTGVLSVEECRNVVEQGLEPFLPDGCHMADADTYALADTAINRYGVIGKSALFNRTLLATRLHPNVTAAYSAVHNRADVFACHDRAAWMRPAAMNPAWDTPFSWPGLHLDISPINYFDGERAQVDSFLREADYSNGNFVAENNAKHHSMGRTVQGVLSLFDNDEEDGGFQCVPGMFGSSLEPWVRTHDGMPDPEVNGRYNFRGFGSDAKLGSHAVRVPCPAGTLILFDATLPHGTKPNASLQQRAILFLRYLTSDELPPEAWQQRNAALRRISAQVGFEPDARQSRHLYGPELPGGSGDGIAG
jgi:ectoine hydroxylase-related dioxygenase (phytanoyl-CoA dioxygenase family)